MTPKWMEEEMCDIPFSPPSPSPSPAPQYILCLYSANGTIIITTVRNNTRQKTYKNYIACSFIRFTGITFSDGNPAKNE